MVAKYMRPHSYRVRDNVASVLDGRTCAEGAKNAKGINVQFLSTIC
jgi:hypothetical protein